MAPKLPGKFKDISKPAASVLDDDYVSSHKFEAKQKTNFAGAVATVTVESGKDAIKTPTKLSFKFPKLHGLAGLSVEKLDYDKEGKYNLECSMTNDMHTVEGLKIEAKHNLADHSKGTATFTYTGFSDTLVKFETKPMALQSSSLESLRATGSTVLGAKFSGTSRVPDVGCSFVHGNLFMSGFITNGCSLFTKQFCFTLRDNMKVAASVDASNEMAIQKYAIGGVASVLGVTAKAKVESFEKEMKLSAGLKKEVVKGMTLLGGVSCMLSSGKTSWGVQVRVE
jgi:hypothetical protein